MIDNNPTVTLRNIKAARNLLSEPGKWAKGGNGPYGPQLCIIDALCRVRSHADHYAFEELRVDLDPRWYGGLSIFNDAPETTLDDVLGLFDRTIARLESAQ